MKEKRLGMPMINTLNEFLATKGVNTAYKFHKETGLPQATAYRLFNKRDVYPDQRTQEIICRTFNAQPGDFLRYLPNEPEQTTVEEKVKTKKNHSKTRQANSIPKDALDTTSEKEAA